MKTTDNIPQTAPEGNPTKAAADHLATLRARAQKAAEHLAQAETAAREGRHFTDRHHLDAAMETLSEVLLEGAAYYGVDLNDVALGAA